MTGNGNGKAVGGVRTLRGSSLSRSVPRPALRRTVVAQGRNPEPPRRGVEPTPELGYRGPSACAAAGITYRQLDYWARTGLVEPSIRPARGSGTQRLYGVRDVLVLKVVKRLLDAGVSLQSIRAAAVVLRAADPAELPDMTLLSDGAVVHRCSSVEEVTELLRDGRGVFGIAVGAVWSDVRTALAELPGERVDTGEPTESVHPDDELARRRRRGSP
ncbi:MerR family transcriptional regulator [Streptomyces sp. ST2-7A]|uniref:MerR family transcriptional regulator n=1 Tax=Streptomyces sp. ST2-7A TaxID=2907214 RepID=UPI0035AB9688